MRTGMLLLLGTMLAPCTGCVTLTSWPGKPALPAPSPACEVQSMWENRLLVTTDTVNHGAPLPGLAGRVYLYGNDGSGHPVIGAGKITVDVLDVSHPGPDGQPRWIEQFNFDPDTLKLLLRKDLVGWGYTLFLPLSHHRPDMTHFQLKIAYVPDKGPPLYAAPTPVTLRADDGPLLIQQRTTTVNKKTP